MRIEVWAYGPLARYLEPDNASGAQAMLDLDDGACMRDLLALIEMPTEERGITFINGNLSAMPGIQRDLGTELHEGDRVALFHPKSMWPFQYRHDVAMLDEFKEGLNARDDAGLRSRYD